MRGAIRAIIRRMRVRDAIAATAAALALAALAAAGDDEERPSSPLARVVHVVRAEDEKPIAGATVEAVGLPGGTLTKTTDADGVAKFPDMPRRGVTFVARLAGRFPAWYDPGGFSWAPPPEDDDPDGDGVTSIALGLTKGTEFSGRVVAKDDGAPIAGATVAAVQETGGVTDVFELRAAPTWTAVTDAEGRFRTASHFPSGFPDRLIRARVTARAPGWISEHVDVKPGGEKSADFRLLRAARLRGVVTGIDGKPAAGVLVHACPTGFGLFDDGPPGNQRTDRDEHPRVLEARTDAQGRYAMDELHPGVKFFVYVERCERTDGDFDFGDVLERSAVAADVGTAAAGEETVADLKLRVLASLVVRATTEGGVAKDVTVDLTGPPHSYPSIDSEAIEGGRKYVRLDPGTYALRVGAPGCVAVERKVEVPEGKTIELTIPLAKGITIDGVVVDDLGAPAADVNVYAHPTTPQGAARTYRDDKSARTDASGAFRLSGLRPGLVDVSAADQRYVFETDVRVTAPMSGLRLVVLRVPFISLRVDAPAGTTLPEKVRAIVTTRAGHYAGMRDGMDVPAADLPATLDRLRPGPVDVTVDIGSFAPATIHVELKPGETAPAGPFAFEPGVTLAGRVVDASGRAVAGARVTPYENDARAATTAADGSFALPHLAAGATELCVVADGFPETRLVATAAEGGYAAVIVLRPGGVVRGIVKSRDGERPRPTRLCICDASAPDAYGPHWHGKIDEDPHFSLRLPAGKYRWVPTRYEFDRGAVVFEVKEGGTTDVAFELP